MDGMSIVSILFIISAAYQVLVATYGSAKLSKGFAKVVNNLFIGRFVSLMVMILLLVSSFFITGATYLDSRIKRIRIEMAKRLSYNEGKFTIKCSSKNDIIGLTYESADLKGKIYSIFSNNEVIANMFDPSNGKLEISQSLRTLLFETLDLIRMMRTKNNCVTITLADFHFNLFLDYYDRRYKKAGRHVLCVSLWKSVLEIVYEWETVNPGESIHKGTPLYYLAETYLLIGNIDTAFIYLFKALINENKVTNGSLFLIRITFTTYPIHGLSRFDVKSHSIKSDISYLEEVE
jgi:hypothetical protein